MSNPATIKGANKLLATIDTELLLRQATGKLVDYSINYIPDDNKINVCLSLPVPTRHIKFNMMVDCSEKECE